MVLILFSLHLFDSLFDSTQYPIIYRSVDLLKARKPNPTQDWLDKLPQMAKRIESSLFKSAPDFRSYSDTTTLNHRIQQLAKKSIFQSGNKGQKELFPLFTKILMQHLETKDPSLRSKAKHIIKEWTKRNGNDASGNSSLRGSMISQLQETVGQYHWSKAEEYLAKHLMEQNKKRR